MSETTKGNSKFDELLKLEDALKGDSYGKVVNPFSETIKTHKGTTEDPLPFPHIEYSEAVESLIHAVYDFHKANPDYELTDYMGILAYYGYTDVNVKTVDVSEMNDKCLMALFMALVRGERFYEGLILQALECGSVQKWLARLRVIASEE